MTTETTFLEPLLDSAEAYAKTSLELLKLKTLDKSVRVASDFALRSVVFFFLVMSGLFSNIAFAIWLGDWLGKMHYGFLGLALFYAIVAAILYFFMYNRLRDYISNSIISQILD